MENLSNNVEIVTSEGRVRGLMEDGLAVFRGVPFARAPTGPFRFKAPVKLEPQSRTIDATLPAPMCPQTPLRLKALGQFDVNQDENCLTSTIWAPLPLDHPKPILVWLHGGALSSGGGGHPWYDGARLARENGIIVASPNYRLGALGFLCLPGLADGNMGFLDQVRALEWIQENAASFGGDSHNITLMGQSAGATSIALMLAKPQVRRLFHRAVFLSGGFVSFPLKSVVAAGEDAERFCTLLGIDPCDPGAMRALQGTPVSQILEAQVTVVRDSARVAGNVLPTFMYTATGVFPVGSALEEAIRDGAAEIDAIIGTTAEEFNAFNGLDPRLTHLTEEDLPEVAQKLFGPSWKTLLDHGRRLRPGSKPSQIITDAQTESFVHPIRQLATAIAGGKGTVWCCRFDWSPPGSEYGACHCIDLPFVFGNFEAFKDAPMLAGGQETKMRALSALLRSAIGQFVNHGSPAGPDLPEWPTFKHAQPVVMVFDLLLQLGWLGTRNLEAAPAFAVTSS